MALKHRNFYPKTFPRVFGRKVLKRLEKSQIALYFQPIDRGGLNTYVARWSETYVQSGLSYTLVSNNLGLRLMSRCPKSDVHFEALERSSIAAKTRIRPNFARILRKSLLLANPIMFMANFTRQTWLLRKLNPSACIAFNGGHTADESCLSLLLAARLLRIPFALVILGSPRERRWLLYMYDRLLDQCLRFAKVIVTNARHIAEHPRISQSSRKTQLLTIVNPTPPIATKPASSIPTASALEAVVVSRLDIGKGLETAIRAVSTLQPTVFSRLDVIGEGLLRSDLEALVEELNETRRIHFLGQVPETEKHQRVYSADLVICPSENEGLPFSLLEAMASGVPIVCSSIPGHLELVRHGEHAHTFSPGNFEDLGRMIVEVHNNRGLAMKLARGAHEVLESIGSFERFATEVRELDARLLEC